MALNKTDLVAIYNSVYDADTPVGSKPVTWDGIGGHNDGNLRRIIALLLNILSAVDPSFAPPTGGTNEPSLTDFSIGVHALPASSYIEVAILIIPGSTGTIEGASVESGANYVFRAAEGKSLGEVNFEVTSGTFQVLTLAVA